MTSRTFFDRDVVTRKSADFVSAVLTTCKTIDVSESQFNLCWAKIMEFIEEYKAIDCKGSSKIMKNLHTMPNKKRTENLII